MIYVKFHCDAEITNK